MLPRDGLEIRDRVLGVDRVTCCRCLEGVERVTTPELDRAVGRGAALEGAGARDVVLAGARDVVLAGAREDRLSRED